MAYATEEIKQWIIEQAQQGFPVAAVLQGMLDSGWKEDDAIRIIDVTLRDYLKENDNEGEIEPEEVLPEAKPVPQPMLPEVGNTVEVDGQPIHVLTVLDDPKIIVFDNVFSVEECAQVIALSKPRMERSMTIDEGGDGEEVNEVRTSSGTFLERKEEPLVQKLDQRIADLLKWPVENGECLQILNYQPGAEYQPHHDYFDPEASGTKVQLARGGQRVATMLVYLNECEQGGATIFPDVGLSVFPRPGLGVYFEYDKPHESTKSLHGGSPVVKGEKWVATRWMREREFN